MEGDTTTTPQPAIPAAAPVQPAATPSPIPVQPAATPPTNPPASQPPQSPPPINPLEKKSKMWLWITIGVSLAIIASAALYFMTPSEGSSMTLEEIKNLDSEEIAAYSNEEIIEICDGLFKNVRRRLKSSCSNESINETYILMAEAFVPIAEADRIEDCIEDDDEGIVMDIFKEECDLSGEEVIDIITAGFFQERPYGSTECFDASASVLISTDFSMVYPESNSITVQVHRGTGNYELAAIDIVLGYGGNTITKRETNIPSVNGDRVYTYSGEDPEFPDFNYSLVEQAGVAAIITSGNTEKTCDKSGMVTIPGGEDTIANSSSDDEAIIDRAITTLFNIDEKIHEVDRALGNRRAIDLLIEKGSLAINPAEDSITWTIESDMKYSESGVEVPIGNMTVLTEGNGPWQVSIKATYDMDVQFDNETNTLVSLGSYDGELFIENLGDNSENKSIIALSYEPMASAPTDCYLASQVIDVSPDFSVLNSSSNTAYIQVHRGEGNFTLTGLEIHFTGGGNSITRQITELPEVNGDKVYTFNGTEFDYGTIDEVSVSAVITEGNTMKVCVPSDPISPPQAT